MELVEAGCFNDLVDPILDALDPEQRRVALLLDAPLVVLAGAGTGKTRAITHRVAHAVREGRYAANATLAVTFTTRAAGELKTRLAGLGVRRVTARTIHAAALSQCRYFWPRAYSTEFPQVAENPFAFVGRAANQVLGAAEATLVRDLQAEIGWAKSSNVPPDRYPELAVGRAVAGVEPERVVQVMLAYEKVKSGAGVVDFDDILLCTAALLVEHPFVAEKVRETYRHFVVDEYQDVSAIQHRLIGLWVDGRPDVCVVGDPQQAIHGFAGARAEFLTGFAAEHEADTVRLVRNYRSSPAIVSLANRIVRRHRGQADLRSTRPTGPEPAFVADGSEDDEAAAVAAWLRECRAEGVRWGECAVLYRINAQSPAIEAALGAAQIPYQVKGADRFWERAEIKDVVNRLQRSVTERPTATPRQLLELVLAAIRWSEEPPSGMGAQRERWEAIAALVQLIRTRDGQDPDWSGPEFGAWLAEHVQLEAHPVSDAVTLATMHAAKGLEWDAVAVIGVREGMVPFSLSQEEPALSEERRLLHVAVTRARQQLRISWPTSPTRGRGVRSRFLTGLVPASAAAAGTANGERRSVRSRVCSVCGGQLRDAAERKLGRHIDCETSYDEELLAALKQWRLETAQAASQPAFVVFTDATLQAIAEAAPTTRTELLRLPGIGKVKVDRYGEQVLAVVAEREK